MSVEQILLVITAVVALVALAVATAALQRLRTITRRATTTEAAPPSPASGSTTPVPFSPPSVRRAYEPLPATREAPNVEVVDGGVVVRPSNRQVVEATMGRPLVRLNIVLFGLTHALRPDSRDRLRSLMRREFRTRRTLRRKQARRAARLASGANSSAPAWLSGMSSPGALDAVAHEHKELEP